ncbi:MAG: ATP-binding protein [Thermoanaerobaculia bacterium]|nr:ATP-binding protein [Thermoanaerobaculia bacterium]
MGDLESPRVERTIATRDTDKFGQALCAFANDLADSRLPGVLFVGVDDAGQPSGLTVTDQLLQNLAAIASDGNLLPPPVVSVEKRILSGGEVAVVEVQPSHDTPVRYKGIVWVRRGPQRGRANPEEERRLSEKRASHLGRPWDSRPCPEATLEDLALELFALDYRRAAVAPEVISENDRPLEHQLAALRFFDFGKSRPTNAGVLLFGTDPEFFFPGAYVQFVRYAGRDRAAEVAADRRLSGDLGQILRALGQLADELAGGRPEYVDHFREVTAYDFPPRALRELLVNAIIHRNYESSSTPIQIDHFEDRLEILNPGGLHPDLSRELFPRGTAYRNPVLAEAARVLGYANRFGRGIEVAQAEIKKNGSPSAEFFPADNHFLVTIWKRP